MGKTSGILSSILVGSFVGIFFAGLCKYLYDNGIWLDEYITGSQTIHEFMFIVIFIWFFIGLLLGVIRSK